MKAGKNLKREKTAIEKNDSADDEKQNAADLHDAELLKAYLAGDENALNELYKINYNQWLSYNKMYSESNVEDATQEQMMAMLFYLKECKYKPDKPFRNLMWIFSRNWNFKKGRKKTPKTKEIEKILEKTIADTPAYEELDEQIFVLLKRVIKRLSRSDEKIVVMKINDGCKWDVIGKKMKISGKAASQRYYRILAQLKNYLKESGINKNIFTN